MINLDDAQKQKVKDWIEEGLKLSDIQSKLASDLGVTMTYMDLRFLIADLGVQPKDKPAEVPPTPAAPPSSSPAAQPADSVAPDESVGPGGVSVTVDQVTRPGALVSGKVTFSDAKTAEWYLDQTGRLGVAPSEAGYKPSQEDLMDFQAELQNQLARLGL